MAGFFKDHSGYTKARRPLNLAEALHARITFLFTIVGAGAKGS